MIVTGASGLDIDALVGGLVAAARVPITELMTKKSGLEAAKTAVEGLSSRLSALKSAATTLSTSAGFASSTVTSSNSAVAVQITGQAAPGTHTIRVDQIARTQRTRSDLRASATDSLSSTGTLAITVGSGSPFQIAVEDGDSLSTVASKINSAGARIHAWVLDTGSGHRLMLSGLDSGAANAFTIMQQGLDLGFEAAENRVQAATDASLTVDGTPVTRPTNQLADVIPGLRLALTGTTTSDATLAVESSPSALVDKLKVFVSAYNDVVSSAHSATGFGSLRAGNRELAGDSVIRGALSAARRAVADPVSGLTGNVRALADVGLEFDADGKLSVDQAKLASALASDSGDAERLFVSSASSGTTSALERLIKAIDAQVTGPDARLSTRKAVFAARASRLDGQRRKMEDRLATYEAQLRKQFIAMEQVVTKYSSASTAIPTNIPSYDR